jgi:CBS domain containing-hemolysin-like protein
LGVSIEAEGFETFGGYILARLGRVPATGEEFDLGDLHVAVLDAERRRVHRLRVRRHIEPAPAETVPDDGEKRP